MILLYITATALIFSATVVIAAREMPFPPKMSAKPIAYALSAPLFAAADIFLLFCGLAFCGSEYTSLLTLLSDNKEAALEFFPAFLRSPVEAIHGFFINIVSFFEMISGKFFGIFKNDTALPIFSAVILLLPPFAVYFLEKRKAPKPLEEIVDIKKTIGFFIGNAFSDAFFVSPIGTAVMFGISAAADIPYKTLLCTALWLLSYIPVIGAPVGIIFGVTVLLLSLHPIKCIIFGITAAAVFALLNFGKDLLTGLSEMKESEKNNTQT